MTSAKSRKRWLAECKTKSVKTDCFEIVWSETETLCKLKFVRQRGFEKRRVVSIQNDRNASIVEHFCRVGFVGSYRSSQNIGRQGDLKRDLEAAQFGNQRRVFDGTNAMTNAVTSER